MTQITGKIYQMTNAAGTENRFPRTVIEAVFGLSTYLQDQFSALANIYMPINYVSYNATTRVLTVGGSTVDLANLSDYYTKTQADARYLQLSGGTMGNANLVTNLNADLLDGKHIDAIEGPLAQGIASNSSRIQSLEDWLANPSLDELEVGDLNIEDTINAGGIATIAGGVKLTDTKKIWFDDTHYLELKDGYLHTNLPIVSDSYITAGAVNS